MNPPLTHGKPLPPELAADLDLEDGEAFVRTGSIAAGESRAGDVVAAAWLPSSDGIALQIGDVAHVAGYRGKVEWDRRGNALRLEAVHAISDVPAAHIGSPSHVDRVVVLVAERLDVYEREDTLEDWLREAEPLASARDVLEFFCAVRWHASSHREALREWLEKRGVSERGVEARTAEVLGVLERRVPVPPPPGQEELGEWLVELEGVVLALAGSEALERVLPGALGLGAHFQPALRGWLGARREALGSVPGQWLHARRFPALVSTAVEQLGLRPGGDAGSAADEEALLRAWRNGVLHLEDASALRELVQQPGRWQAAYRRQLAEDLHETPSARFPGPTERVLQRYPWPHRGHGFAVELRQAGASLASILVPTEQPLGQAALPQASDARARVSWGDAISGPLTVEVETRVATPGERRRALVAELEGWLSPERGEGASAPEVAALAEELCSLLPESAGALALARAAAQLARDEDTEPETIDAMAELLHERLVLEAATLAVFDDAERSMALSVRLLDLDEALAPFADALTLLDASRYWRLVENTLGGEASAALRGVEAWWARPAELERRLPGREVAAALKVAVSRSNHARPGKGHPVLATLTREPRERMTAATVPSGVELIDERLLGGGRLHVYSTGAGGYHADFSATDAELESWGAAAGEALDLRWFVRGTEHSVVLRREEPGQWQGEVTSSIGSAERIVVSGTVAGADVD